MIQNGYVGRKKIICFTLMLFLAAVLFCPALIERVDAAEKDKVYTSLTGSTTDTAKGNGTAADPYNRFETAVENVKDGGTIYIKATKGAFINGDEYGRLPYVIEKNITVMPEPGASMAELSVRAAGIVLNADVTFQNIRLDFGNKTHDAIFAKGHKLTLINVSRSDASREIDLFAGGLNFNKDEHYYTDENENGVAWPEDIVKKVEGSPADKGSIEIRTDEKYADKTYGCSFGNIYAGSMNGEYAGSANIIIDDSGSKIDKIETVYARGAHEAASGNMFDFSEPEPPSADNENYVEGDVSITLINQQVDTIDGFHGTKKSQNALGKTSLAVSTKYRLEYVNISDVDEITAESGTFAPQVAAVDNAFKTLTIKEGAELDLSCGTNWDVTGFAGGGALTLAKKGRMRITGALNGTTRLKTADGMGDASGVAVAGHTYIISDIAGERGRDSFIFTPHNTQPSYGILYDEETLIWTVGVTEGTAVLPKLKDFRFVPEKQVVTYELINGLDNFAPRDFVFYNTSAIIDNAEEYIAVNKLLIQYALTDIPFSYKVVKEGSQKEYTPKTEGYIGNYYVEIPDLNMVLTVEYDENRRDEAAILMVYALDDKERIESGTYKITLAADDKDGEPISQTVTMTVLEEGSASGKTESTLALGSLMNTSMWKTLDIPVTLTGTEDNSGITEDLFSVYVNGTKAKSGITLSGMGNNSTVTASVAVTPENGFVIGSDNKVVVAFDGTSELTSALVSGATEVSKGSITISDNVEKTYSYNGVSHPYEGTPTVGGEGIPKSVKETAKENLTYLYRKQGGVADSKAPVHPGSYDVLAVIPEGELYEAVTEANAQKVGTITIEKAMPGMTLSGTVAVEKTLTVKATMSGSDGCTVPWGNVYFSIQNETEGSGAGTSGVAALSYGEASYRFTSLPEGEYTVTTLYVGDSKNGTVGLNEAYQTGISAIADFTVSSNHISVTGIALSEKNATLSVGGADKQLTVTFAPEDATNRTVSWESGDETVVTVNANGLVKPVAVGSSYVAVTSRDGGYKDSCFITVEKVSGSTSGDGSGSGGGASGGSSSTPEEPSDPSDPSEPEIPKDPDDSTMPTEPEEPSDPGGTTIPTTPAIPPASENPSGSAGSAETDKTDGNDTIVKETVKTKALAKVTNVKIKKAKKARIKISWKNIKGETGYQIARSKYKKKNFKVIKTIKSNKAKSVTIKAKKNRKFYYKVRAYQVTDGGKVYGPWSKVRTYKLK